MKQGRTQHALWAAICAALVCVVAILASNNFDLYTRNQRLESALAAVQPNDCQARDTWTAGTSRLFHIAVGAQQRSYIVHLPAKFQNNKDYPLVMYFSGKGKDAADSEQYSSYNALPAVVVYPNPTVGNQGAYAWESAPYASGANDVQFINTLLDHINGQLCIDRSHVYAVGVSNGGGFVGLLSCTMSDRIVAFGMVAGAFYAPESNCTPKKPAPLIEIHGEADPVVPFFGSLTRHLPDIDTWAAHRASQNGCKPQPFVSNHDSAIVTKWQGCKNNATVHSIRQIGVGHAWTPADRDTIWQFLSSY